MIDAPAPLLIGYARVSTQAQNPRPAQIAALNATGYSRIFAEKASGKSVHNRPELERALTALPTDGVLVIAEWDRATRSMLDGINIIDRVLRVGATVKVLDRAYLDRGSLPAASPRATASATTPSAD